jgi:hypothetical protein
MTLLAKQSYYALFLDHAGDLLFVNPPPGGQHDWTNAGRILEHHDFYEASRLIERHLRHTAKLLLNAVR